jgi:MFS family permease
MTGVADARGSRFLLPALVLATTTTAISGSLGAPLVPEVAVTEGVSITDAQWTLTAALLAGAIAVPILGRLGTHRYRRPVLIAAIVAAVVGTFIAALPLGFAGILVGRVLQGISMGATPVAIALARNVLPAAKQASALSLLSVSVVVGAGLGFPLASLFATLWGLPAAYWFGFAVSILTLLVVVRVVPGATDGGPEPRVDWAGAVVLSVGSAALLLAVTQGEQWGWASPLFLGSLALAVVALGGWGWRSLRIPNPLVDLRVAVRAGVLAPNIISLLGGIGMYMLLSLIVFIVQTPVADGGFGQTPFIAGLLMVPYSAGSFAASRFNLLLVRRIPHEMLLPIGCAFYSGALVLIGLAHTEIWTLVVAMLLAGLGSGSTFAAMPGLVFRHVEPRESGSAVATNQLLRSFGTATGSAVTAAILGLFIAAGAVHPDPVGFTVTGLVAAGLLAVGVVVSLVLGLREIRAGRATEGDEGPEDPTALEI